MRSSLSALALILCLLNGCDNGHSSKEQASSVTHVRNIQGFVSGIEFETLSAYDDQLDTIVRVVSFQLDSVMVRFADSNSINIRDTQRTPGSTTINSIVGVVYFGQDLSEIDSLVVESSEDYEYRINSGYFGSSQHAESLSLKGIVLEPTSDSTWEVTVVSPLSKGKIVQCSWNELKYDGNRGPFGERSTRIIGERPGAYLYVHILK